jgi:ATP-dependent DNA helicase DinG
MECPGAARCPQGAGCFAEAAIARARDADVIVTNHHLYGLHLASGRRILPEHDVVVFDEAHKLEGALSSAFGVDIGAGRLNALAGNAARLIDPKSRRDRDPMESLREAAAEMQRVFRDLPPERVEPSQGEVGSAILAAINAVAIAQRALLKADEGDPLAGPIARAKAQAGHVAGDFDMAFDLPGGYVSWAEPHRGVVRVAPVQVDAALGESLLVETPAILTSATLTVGRSFAPLARRLGLVEEAGDDPLAAAVEDPIPRTYERLQVDGSFDYAASGLLYVASHLPDPRDDAFIPAALDEIAELTSASGGRALVLATSHRMVDLIAGRLATGPFRLLVQGQLPKKRLMASFAAEETSTLVATMGYWEGIDVPGPSLSLVVIDKLPFPRPDDPLTQARREAVEARGGSAFGEIDLPIATMLVAQGAGRLVRSEQDRGVVAILDRRLHHKGYGRRMLVSLPRLLRTSDRMRAVRYLEGVAAGAS